MSWEQDGAACVLSGWCPGLGQLVLAAKAEHLASGSHCTCLSGTLTEQLGLYFCIQIRGTLSCLEEVQEQGGKILGGKVLGPVLGVSPCLHWPLNPNLASREPELLSPQGLCQDFNAASSV